MLSVSILYIRYQHQEKLIAWFGKLYTVKNLLYLPLRNGNVIATAHTIGTSTIPTKKQVSNSFNVPTYKPKTERLFLIRGASKDFAILKASWCGFLKGQRSVKGKLGDLQLKIFRLGEMNAQWIQIKANPANPFQWPLYESNGYIDLKQSIIRISKNTTHVPENICIATTISVAFVLC